MECSWKIIEYNGIGPVNKKVSQSSERVKVALHPSNAKRLYMDEKSTEKGEIEE